MLPPDHRAGLARLAQAVKVEHRPAETPRGVRSRLEFCQLWQPEDSVESFQRRNHRWSEVAVQNRLTAIRRILGIPKYQHVRPFELAQQYIALHARYLRDIIAEV